MLIMLDSGRQIDTEYPVENNPNKVMSINKTGILMDHGDKDGSFFFYPWASIQFIVTSVEAEKKMLGGL